MLWSAWTGAGRFFLAEQIRTEEAAGARPGRHSRVKLVPSSAGAIDQVRDYRFRNFLATSSLTVFMRTVNVFFFAQTFHSRPVTLLLLIY
jgi:hypothetical protein